MHENNIFLYENIIFMRGNSFMHEKNIFMHERFYFYAAIFSCMKLFVRVIPESAVLSVRRLNTSLVPAAAAPRSGLMSAPSHPQCLPILPKYVRKVTMIEILYQRDFSNRLSTPKLPDRAKSFMHKRKS